MVRHGLHHHNAVAWRENRHHHRRLRQGPVGRDNSDRCRRDGSVLDEQAAVGTVAAVAMRRDGNALVLFLRCLNRSDVEDLLALTIAGISGVCPRGST